MGVGGRGVTGKRKSVREKVSEREAEKEKDWWRSDLERLLEKDCWRSDLEKECWRSVGGSISEK